MHISIFICFGVLAILALEHHHAFKGLSWHQSLFYSLFQSATTRSAGLQTIDVTNFSDATNVIMYPHVYWFISKFSWWWYTYNYICDTNSLCN